MMVYPSYYHKFSCIASRCRHSCCIGWEIDIDEDSYEFYQTIKGKLGDRLCRSIVHDAPPHFKLGEGERCPFLNRDNLCDLILTLGEGSLCEICREHPRFYSVMQGRTEVGLGLCCEEAARLILSEDAPMTLVMKGEPTDETGEWEKRCLSWREEVFSLLQNRGISVFERADRLMARCQMDFPALDETIKKLLTLEIMTPEWKALLSRYQKSDEEAFCRLMASREYEYEQFMVYLAYRYLVTAYDEDDLMVKTAFIAWSFRLLVALGSFLYAEKGAFTPEDQIELARLFSVEIEYDEDNLEALLEEI